MSYDVTKCYEQKKKEWPKRNPNNHLATHIASNGLKEKENRIPPKLFSTTLYLLAGQPGPP